MEALGTRCPVGTHWGLLQAQRRHRAPGPCPQGLTVLREKGPRVSDKVSPARAGGGKIELPGVYHETQS